MFSTNFTRKPLVALLRLPRPVALGLCLVAMAMALPSIAQQPPGGGQPELSPEQLEQLQTFEQKREEFIQLQQKLEQIERAAVQANPELQEQQEEFAALVMDKMKSKGHSPEEDVAELQDMQARLQSPETPPEERQSLMGDLQQKASELEAAQREALEEPEVQQARGELVEAITTAMKQENPQTEQIIREMEQKQQELMQIHESVNRGAAR